jgi:radical SAM-linked protein
MMTDQERYRYRITYSKTSAMRFTGHLDLQRCWERTFRRARLPLAYTQGFNPHPRINIGAALPLGWTSECEFTDIQLEESISPEVLLDAIQKASPLGLEIHTIDPIPLNAPKLQKQISALRYLSTFSSDLPDSDLQSRIQALLSAATMPRVRRGKKYDLRPLIKLIQSNNCAQGDVQLEMVLTAREGATGRPDEVLLALGFDPNQAHIHRIELVLAGL